MHGPQNVKSEDGGSTFPRNVLNISFPQGASTLNKDQHVDRIKFKSLNVE